MKQQLAQQLAADLKIHVTQVVREYWEIVFLNALPESPHGKNLVFRGGTALRLPYGSPRFSEALDFVVSDLEKITGLERESLHVALNRLVKRGVLQRVMRGLYVLPGTPVSVERIAHQVYFPSYLSFETVLSRAGVLNLVPYSLTFATTKKTRSFQLLGQHGEYRRIREELFFGYQLVDGCHLAKPEKALLDLAYLASLGKASLMAEEFDPGPLSLDLLREFARKFPPRVRRRLE